MFKSKVAHEPSFWYSGAAVACFVLAVTAAAVGSILTTAPLINAQLHPTLHSIGLIALIVSLPIFILAGHCLDLKDRKHEQSKLAKHTVQA